uniref:Uncharacterized protein n=1 Tax=Anguilla anguilla TaxID=7936 RepID=A0A0E9P6Y1_ANGAN
MFLSSCFFGSSEWSSSQDKVAFTHEKILKGSLTQIALISVGGLLVWIHFNWSHRGCRDEEVSSSSLSRQCSL